MKLKTVKDLPPDQVMIGFIKQVVKLNDQGVKRKKSATKKPEAEEPA